MNDETAELTSLSLAISMLFSIIAGRGGMARRSDQL
jgi:hypothetical protein